jgi:hypothetical protein
MFDPITSLSLACNILQILEYGGKVIKMSHEIYETGLTKDDGHLSSLLSSFAQLTVNVPTPSSNADSKEKEYFSLVEKCAKLTSQLQDLIKADQPTDPKSKRRKVVATAKTIAHIKRKRELKEQLDDCRDALELYLVFLNRFVFTAVSCKLTIEKTERILHTVWTRSLRSRTSQHGK